MTHRYFPAKFLSILALAALAMPSANAGILGSTSSGISLGDTALSTEDTTSFTSEDLALMRDKRKEARTRLKKLDTQITAMEAALKANEKSATPAKLEKLKQQRADTQELIDALDMLILQAKADLRDTSKDTDTDTSTDTATDTSGGSGSQGTGDMIKQAALTGLLQGMLGGNNSALNGLMNNLTGGLGSGLTGGLDGLTGGPTGGYTGNQGEETITVTDETPDDKKADNDLPECAPSTEEDTSPGRRNAETGSTEGAIDATTTQTSGSGTTATVGDFGMHAAHDRPTTANPEQRDDSGKTVKKEPKKEKPKCNPIDVASKNPQSKGGNINSGEAPNMYGVKSLADARRLIEAQGGNCSTTAKNGISCSIGGRTIGVNAQCTSFPRSEIPHATPFWREGDPVDENTPIGTWVSTFNNGDRYGTNAKPGGDYGFSHTGMYLGRTSDGSIILLDQFKKGKLNIRTYSCNGGLEGCDKYYTIRTPGRAWLKPLLQPYQLAHNMVFFAKTLLIG